MFKLFILLAFTVIILVKTAPAYCMTMTYQVSVTIPPHIMMNNDPVAAALSNNPDQIVQTQTVVRNNRTVTITSILVP